MRLQEKVALVTGAADSRSIGWGIARALADEGADVVVNDVAHLDDLEKRAAELRLKGRRALAVPGDISKPDQVAALIDRTVAEMGCLDILANSAGIIRWEPFVDITADGFRAIVDVNLKGNILICKAAADQMIRQGCGGRIIIVSSVQADLQYPNAPVYAGTKHAMHIFVGCLALELAQYGVTVNHVGPGWVRTALNDPAPGQQTPEEIASQKRAVPLGHRPGLPYEMGRAAVYFASSDGDYVTGAYLRVEGGLALGKD